MGYGRIFPFLFMNDIQAAEALLQATIRDESTHADYDTVVAQAAEYHDIFTGTGIEAYLKAYRNNESDALFKQMLTIYETTIPATVHNISTIFEKPLRSNRIYNTIEAANNAREEILSRMQNFWQGETESGLDAYLKERWKHLCLYDPNAFIAVEFSDFDPVKEKAQPFAVEYTSEEVILPHYIKGVLDYLICERSIFYKQVNGQAETFVEGSKFIMYLENDAIVYTEVDPKQRLTDIDNPEFIFIFKTNNKSQKPDRVFVRQVFNTKSNGVPAFRAGYMPNPETNGRTVLSTIHYALPFFKKELKSGVELDLTIRAHVFPQKYAYGTRCEGDKENGQQCLGGKTANGGTCPVCNGTTVSQPIHTTAQEIVWIPLPKPGQEALDLTKAMAYFSPPMELVKFMVEYTDRLTAKAKGAVFPSQAIATSNNNLQPATTTATEQDYSWDNVYDAYRPFTAKYSFAWLFITRLIAVYTDNFSDTLVLYHKFPSDYKLKSVLELLAEAKAAQDGNLPQHVTEAIHEDIANIYYADDPDTLTKIAVKNKFYPFSGKSETEVQAILLGADILPYYKILYIYFDVIFNQVDEELGDAFYMMTVDKQKAEVKKRVDAIIAEVDKNKAQSFKVAQKNFNLQAVNNQDAGQTQAA